MADCESCPANSIADGTKLFCLCNEGYYMNLTLDTPSGVAQNTCLTCDPGAICDVAGTTFETMKTREGWWRAGKLETEYTRCLLRSHCMGGVGSTCAGHRTGAICSICEEGYSSSNGIAECEVCPSSESSTIFAVVFILFLLCFIYVVYWVVLRVDNDLMHATKLMDMTAVKLSAQIEALIVKEELQERRDAQKAKNIWNKNYKEDDDDEEDVKSKKCCGCFSFGKKGKIEVKSTAPESSEEEEEDEESSDFMDSEDDSIFDPNQAIKEAEEEAEEEQGGLRFDDMQQTNWVRLVKSIKRDHTDPAFTYKRKLARIKGFISQDFMVKNTDIERPVPSTVFQGLPGLYPPHVRGEDYDAPLIRMEERDTFVKFLYSVQFDPLDNTEKQMLGKAMNGRPAIVLRNRRSPYFMTKMKIMLSFLQIAVNLPFVVDVPWPPTFLEFCAYFDMVNLNFMPWQTFGCISDVNYYEKMLATAMTLPAAILILFLMFLLPRIMTKVYDYSEVEFNASAQELLHLGIKRQRRKFWKLCLFTVFLVTPNISRSVARFFSCQLINGDYYLTADYGRFCYDETWYQFLPWAIIFFALYPVGVPITIMIVLLKYKKRMNHPEIRLSLGFLYEAFHNNRWWMEVLNTVMKICLTSMVGYIPKDYQMQGVMCLVCLHLSIILVLEPYVRIGDDRFHLLMMVELSAFIFAGYIIRSKNSEVLDTRTDVTISILLICLILTLVIMFMFVAAQNVEQIWRKQRDRQRRKRAVKQAKGHVSGSKKFGWLSKRWKEAQEAVKQKENRMDFELETLAVAQNAKPASLDSEPVLQAGKKKSGTTFKSNFNSPFSLQQNANTRARQRRRDDGSFIDEESHIQDDNEYLPPADMRDYEDSGDESHDVEVSAGDSDSDLPSDSE